MKTVIAAIVLWSVGLPMAQTKATLPAAEPTGVITGRVMCADNNLPARFAKVWLEPVPKPGAVDGKDVPAHVMLPYTGNSVTTVDVGLDGTFALSKVKPGSYYVLVSKAGYVTPRDMFTAKEMNSSNPEVRAMIDRALARVEVDNSETAHVEIRLERGAAISGTILFDDGSPVGSLSVNLLQKNEAGEWKPLPSVGTRTAGWGISDDRGRFRIGGLLPDEYMLKVELMMGSTRDVGAVTSDGNFTSFSLMNFGSTLRFYGEGTPFQAKAKAIKVGAGVEMSGQDMTLPVSKLFRLTGKVLTGTDGHAVNAAELKLLTAEDGKELTSSSIDREDGMFHFDFVPPGEYKLLVMNARDVEWEPLHAKEPGAAFQLPRDTEHSLHKYGEATQPLTVNGDVLGMTLNVPADAVP